MPTSIRCPVEHCGGQLGLEPHAESDDLFGRQLGFALKCLQAGHISGYVTIESLVFRWGISPAQVEAARWKNFTPLYVRDPVAV